MFKAVVGTDLLKEARLRAGLTQAELARRANRSRSQIAHWERGDVRPSIDTLRRLVRACGFDLTFVPAEYNAPYLPHIERQLALMPAERVERMAGVAATERGLRERMWANADPGVPERSQPTRKVPPSMT